MKTVNILNVKYKVSTVNSPNDMSVKGRVGEVNYSDKTIKITKTFLDGDTCSDSYMEDTFLHEVAHAFLYETGNDDINDERVVELMTKFSLFTKNINLK